MTEAGTPIAAAMWSTTRMMSTRSLRASGGRTPGTTCCRSGQANKVGGRAAARASTATHRPRRLGSALVVWVVDLAHHRRLEPEGPRLAASSSAVAEAWTARDSESKKRLAGSSSAALRRVMGCVTSVWRARTTSAWSASSSRAEMKATGTPWRWASRCCPRRRGCCRRPRRQSPACRPSRVGRRMRYCRR